MNSLSNVPESAIAKTHFYGTKQCFTFDDYVHILEEQHMILNDLSMMEVHAGVSEATMVHNLMNGIHADRYDAVKTRILSNEALRGNFDQCVSLYQDFIKNQVQDGKESFSVAAVEVQGRSVDIDSKKLDIDEVKPDDLSRTSATSQEGAPAFHLSRC